MKHYNRLDLEQCGLREFVTNSRILLELEYRYEL